MKTLALHDNMKQAAKLHKTHRRISGFTKTLQERTESQVFPKHQRKTDHHPL